MTARYRSVVAVLSLTLVVLVGALIGPSLVPAGARTSPTPSFHDARPYVEGMLGRATEVSPFSARTPADRALVALVFRGLVRLGPGDTIVPDLASSWETDESGRRWTFHLRRDLSWQDGAPLTASDVVFTLSALADPTYTGPVGESWREVSASAPDPRTVVLTLATPLGGFLDAATQPIAPAHILGALPPAELAAQPFGKEPVGSGWFRLTRLDADGASLVAWSPGDSTMGPDEGGGGIEGDPVDPSAAGPTAGPDDATFQPIHGTRPELVGMEFRFFDDAATLRAAWGAGELDGASGLMPADAAALGADPGSRLVRYPGTTLLPVVLDLRRTHPEFRDPAIRAALLQAIDRDAIVTDVLAGQGARADAPIPPTSSMFDPAISTETRVDRKAADAALVKAGWTRTSAGWTPKGATAPVSIELLSPEDDANPIAYAIAASVARDWSALGLAVTHVALPASELVGDRLQAGDFAAAVVPVVIGLDPDLYPLLASTQTTSGGSNFSGLQDAALDALLVAARAPGPDASRKAAYARLQERLAAMRYLLPIAFRDEVVVLRDTVQGPVPRAVGGPGDRFWDVLTWRLADGR